MKDKTASAQPPVPTTDATPAAGTVKLACHSHNAEMLLGVGELVSDSSAVVSAPGQDMTTRAQISC